jgi:hypothetical protein
MMYAETYQVLKDTFDQRCDRVEIPGRNAVMANLSFVSEARRILPGAPRYYCDTHQRAFMEEIGAANAGYDPLAGPLGTDFHLASNSEFRYTVFKRKETAKAPRAILLLHGLNERYWHKYLPWAMRLLELTESPVCLFPIAFHMNRAPAEWGSPKPMNQVARGRQEQYPAITSSSFANAAISTRLQGIPQRFAWSGVQTYYDLMQLMKEIRSGAHPFIAADARVDTFSYSIGSFLAQIMFMSNHRGYFDDARLFLFCGGPTFDRMYPVSKYIMDSEALVCLYSYFVEQLENECKRDPRLMHYFYEGHTSGLYFRAMLSHRKLKAEREKRLRELAGQISAVALTGDAVIQPGEVLSTLRGDFRDIPVPVTVLDFPFEYSHVNPFPTLSAIAPVVDREFEQVFGIAAEHFLK